MQNNFTEFAKLHKQEYDDLSKFYFALLPDYSFRYNCRILGFREPYILLLDVTAMDKQQSSYTSSEEEEKNEALALRYHNDIFSKGKLEVADEILSSDFVLHNTVLPEELRKGPEGIKKYASAITAAVPDRKLVHDDIFAKGDKVLIRWTNSGTNTGPLFGNPPTGKPYVATGFDLYRISNGKIMEMWQQYNFASWP
jgi:steroid delta-isomerase-like uncharacterized protein